MAPKTGMTAKLLLLAATAYALLSLISLTGALESARCARDAAADELEQLQNSISELRDAPGDAAMIESAARNELKMVFSGEKLLLPKP